MSTAEDEEDVGYRKPPKRTRWKKGQSGNPGKVKAKHLKKNWQIVEDVFAMEIDISENGVRRRVSVFEAISLQLEMNSVLGSKRAVRTLHRYEAFAKTKPDFYVVTPEEDAEEAAKFEQWLKGGME